MITIVVTVCHLIAGEPDICYDRVVGRTDTATRIMVSCEMSQPALAEWKGHSIYAGDDWWIAGYRCLSGNYIPGDTI